VLPVYKKVLLLQQNLFVYNTQEKVEELGEGHTTAEFWEYDSRLGRRWNIDPITYEWQSSYACFNNNPIYFNDPEGLEGKPDNSKKGWYKNNHGDYFYQNDKKTLPIGPDLVWEYIKPNAVPGDGRGEMKNNSYPTIEDFNTKSNYAKSQAEKLAATRAMMARYNAAKRNAANTQGGLRPATLTATTGSSYRPPVKSQSPRYIPPAFDFGTELIKTTRDIGLGVVELGAFSRSYSEKILSSSYLKKDFNLKTIQKYARVSNIASWAGSALGVYDLY